jgi:hypothetical protein
MSKILVPVLLYFFLVVCALSQLTPKKVETAAKAEKPSADFSKEGVVIEQSATVIAFNSDGTETREQATRVRIQSDAGFSSMESLISPTRVTSKAWTLNMFA